MADGLSVAASIIAVLQLTQSVIKYISNIKDAPKECRKLLLDFKYLEGLLDIIKNTVQDADNVAEWDQTMVVLKGSGSPIESLKTMLEPFVIKLQKEACKNGFQKMVSSLLWPLTKKQTEEVAIAIERQKLLLDIAVSNDHLRLSTEIKRDTSKLIQNVKNVQIGLDNVALSVVEIKKSQNENDVIETFTWLSPLQYQSTQSDTYRQRLVGSITWFLQSSEFQSWMLGHHSSLFCIGMPGAGKSVLAATVIHHLQEQFPETVQEVGIAWLYCSFQERVLQTTTNLLGSLVAQLISRREDLIEAAILLRHETKSSKASLKNIKSLLTKCKDSYNKIYLVIDALDEYSEDGLGWTEFITELRDLGEDFNMLITSRPVASIENHFCSASQVKIEAQDSDTRAYVQAMLGLPEFQRHLKDDNQLRVHIEDTIIRKAKGMFLLIKLHMDALRRKTTFSKAALRNAIDLLPKQLDQTYEQALDRIKLQAEDDAELAEHVLSWLHLSYSALTVRTLQQAIAKQQNLDPADDESLIDGEKLASVCAGLVAINYDSQIIGFVHFTVAEYLDSRFENLYPGSRRIVDYCCFHHIMWSGHLLSMIYRETGPIISPIRVFDFQSYRFLARSHRKWQYQRLPFWDYALFHMQKLQDRTQTHDFGTYRYFLKPLDASRDIVEATVMEETFVLLLRHYIGVEDYRNSLGKDLTFAVYVQEESECWSILNDPYFIQSQSILSACLAYSVFKGTDAMVQLFINANADLEVWHRIVRDDLMTKVFGLRTESTSLGIAVWERAKAKIKLILDRKADLINLPAIKYHMSGRNLDDAQTPLQIAMNAGANPVKTDKEREEWLEIAQLLRSYGAIQSVAR